MGSLEGKGRGPVFASSSSCIQRFIDTHLILLDAFAEGRAHVPWWVSDDINLSPKFHFELMGEFVKRAKRHVVAANKTQIDIAIMRLLASGKRAKQICLADVVLS